MESIKRFINNEIVLCVTFILAIVSSFVVHPDRRYISYIDFRTLSILLALMITMAGLQRLQVFRQIGELLVAKMSSIRGVVLVLLALCFFSSMFITNDVALLTFVPFSIVTLSISNRKDLYIIVIVLETIAANLGSMLTPLGNPQNLYLYSLAGMSLPSFIMLMLPYSVAALALLILCGFIFVKAAPVALSEKRIYDRTSRDKKMIGMYVFTFFVSILVVARVLDYRIGLAIVVVLTLILDRRVLRKPDYSLLFTFIFLFIFIGNIKRMPALSDAIGSFLKINEVGVSIFLSQFISNVPAAILCSGFTDNIEKLIIGTNLGGLGTLIASMASLISFKQYSYIDGADKKKYIGVFTVANIIFLLIMLALAFVLKAL
ncbi:Na+/H+ antiporter NhaD [Pseudobutyrivibrio sp. YE44]|uniref:SLC13 family permease n=1 Tax=Pseudobutyrivibrio sp. YE44 TaxID=1520802 RepID=UPI00088DD820|nr:SLC13 family permease [Pseudobutyrivibrio sp. YE44]SDB43024.1 Na+/H+ antiporter NhaD [Pseudobutyrivibrio sp. YE44]